MADKSFVITADFGGTNFDTSQLDPSVLTGSLDKNAAIAERNNALLETLVADTTGASGSPEDFAKRKGKPGRPRKEEEEQEQEEAVSRWKTLNFILDNMQKGVIALNGVNGRVTKITAVFRRSIKLLSDAVDKHTENTKKAADAGNPDDPDSPEGKVAKAAAKTTLSLATLTAATGSLLLGIGTVIAGLTALSAVTYLAGKLINAMIESLQNVVGEFSGALEAQKAATEVALIEQQLRASKQVGGELASLEGSTRELKVAMEEMLMQIIDLLSGPLQVIVELLSGTMTLLNKILGGVNTILERIGDGIAAVLSLADGVPILGRIAGWLKSWIDDDMVQRNMDATKSVRSLFDLGNIFRDPGMVKRMRRDGFIPPKE